MRPAVLSGWRFFGQTAAFVAVWAELGFIIFIALGG